MIDLRLYRYALLAVPLVAVIAMFSLQDVPRSLTAGIPPDAFDPASAVPIAKHLHSLVPVSIHTLLSLSLSSPPSSSMHLQFKFLSAASRGKTLSPSSPPSLAAS